MNRPAGIGPLEVSLANPVPREFPLALSMGTSKSAGESSCPLEITSAASSTSHISATPAALKKERGQGFPKHQSLGHLQSTSPGRNAEARREAGRCCCCRAGCWRKTVVSGAGGAVGGFIVVVFVIYGWWAWSLGGVFLFMLFWINPNK